jgi:hypothetical protein
MTRICVYAGSSPGASPAYAAAARGFGRACARRGLGIVYGGGGSGLMGELADAALELLHASDQLPDARCRSAVAALGRGRGASFLAHASSSRAACTRSHTVSCRRDHALPGAPPHRSHAIRPGLG